MPLEPHQSFLGIDPGKNGAAVLLCENDRGRIIDIQYIEWNENVHEIIHRLTAWNQHHCIQYAVLEKPAPFPGQNVKATASQFENVGQWYMLVSVLMIPFAYVPPRTWMKDIVPLCSKQDKAMRKVYNQKRAIELFPEYNQIFSTPRGRILDGIVDACLMAEKARRLYKGGRT